MIVNVTFEENENYLGSTGNTTFNVTKLSTITTASVLNSTIGNVTLNINVTDTNNNKVNGTVKVYKDGTVIATGSVTDGTINITIPSGLDADETYLVVEYQEDTYYLASNATNNTIRDKPENTTYINVTRKTPSIKIFIDKNNLTIDENVIIRGYLLNGDNIVYTGNVNVTINETNYPTIITNGMYVLTNITSTSGVFNVNATFAGNDELDSVTSDTLTFTVNKKSVTTLISIANNTIGNTSINVKVYDENIPIQNGTLEISSSEFETFTVEINSTTTNIPLPFITTGTKDIMVKYLENNRYLESTGLIYDENQEEVPFDEITIQKRDTILIVTTNAPVTIGNQTVVSGRLLDEEGNPIPSADVLVTFNGESKNTTTDSKGNYNETFTTTKVRNNTIAVTYDGSDIYTNASGSADVEVVKVKATIIDTLPSNAKANKTTTINGTVTDEFGKPVSGINVTVTVNDKEFTAITNDDGSFSVSVDNVVVGQNNVTISSGDDNTTVEDVTGSFNVNKEDAILTVDSIGTLLIGDNLTVSGQLLDSDGNPIVGAEVNVTVGNESTIVTTDSNGKYELVTPITTLGSNNVTVTFESENYNAVKENTSFNTTKHNVILTVYDIVGIVGEDITLTANVTDEEGNPVTGGNLVFKLNGRTLRTDGRFDTNDTHPMKFKVVNGIVTFTMLSS